MNKREGSIFTLVIGALIGACACAVVVRVAGEGLDFASLAQSVNVLLTLVIAIVAFVAIRTQVILHHEVHRPVIACDFVDVHDVVYFRVKNFGSVSASNIEIKWAHPQADCSFDPGALLVKKDRISLSLLTPDAELFYFCQGPGKEPCGSWLCDLKYSDPRGRDFVENTVLNARDFSYVDIGRHKNAPIVRKLEQIAKALHE